MEGSLSYKVVIEPQEGGGYTAYVPSLSGCVSEGETYEETLKNIKEAIELYVETLRERNLPVKKDSCHIAEVQCGV